MGHSILFVDDEKTILSALRRIFLDDDYEIYLASSGEEGLDILKNNSISVIVSDIKMPGMDGIEFLERAREISPDTIRMALSGYADRETVMRAINKGNIWRYITKPWDNDDLRLSIKNAIEIYEESKERKRLMKELERKNQELEKFNKILEDKVKERTWELQAKTDILNMIIEDYEMEEILKKACEVLSKLINSESVFIFVSFLNNLYYNKAPAFSEHVERIGKKVIEKNHSIWEGNILGVPLSKGEIVYGSLVVESVEDTLEQRIWDVVNSFIPIITLVLSQQKLIHEAPRLMENISKIIEEI